MRGSVVRRGREKREKNWLLGRFLGGFRRTPAFALGFGGLGGFSGLGAFSGLGGLAGRLLARLDRRFLPRERHGWAVVIVVGRDRREGVGIQRGQRDLVAGFELDVGSEHRPNARHRLFASLTLVRVKMRRSSRLLPHARRLSSRPALEWEAAGRRAVRREPPAAARSPRWTPPPATSTEENPRFDWYGFSSYVTQSVMRAAHQQSERRLRLIAGVVVGVGLVLYLARDSIKKQMSEEAAELTSRTLEHESIRASAEMVGKYLAHEILHDPNVADAATTLTKDVLVQQGTKEAALDLVTWIVEKDVSRDVVRSLLKNVVMDLAQDDDVVQRLAELVAAALGREAAKNATVLLGAELLDDDRTLDAAKRLAIRLLEREDSRAALTDAFAAAAHRALDDDDVRDHASRAVRDALSDRKVQKTAGDALWNAYKYSIGLGPRRINTPPVATGDDDRSKLPSKAAAAKDVRDTTDVPAPPDHSAVVVSKEDPRRSDAPSLALDTVPTPTRDDATPQLQHTPAGDDGPAPPPSSSSSAAHAPSSTSSPSTSS